MYSLTVKGLKEFVDYTQQNLVCEMREASFIWNQRNESFLTVKSIFTSETNLNILFSQNKGLPFGLKILIKNECLTSKYYTQGYCSGGY